MNLDHYCLVLGPTDMHQLQAELQAKGIQVEETVRPAWGAQGYGQQFKLWDPDGNKIELRGTEQGTPCAGVAPEDFGYDHRTSRASSHHPSAYGRSHGRQH